MADIGITNAMNIIVTVQHARLLHALVHQVTIDAATNTMDKETMRLAAEIILIGIKN